MDASERIVTIPVGRYPDALAGDWESQRVYVANVHGQSLSVITTNTGTVTTVPIGHAVSDVAVDLAHDIVYVLEWRGVYVWLIDGRTARVLDRLRVGLTSGKLWLDPQPALLYLPHPLDGTVSIVDGTARSRVATVPCDSYPELVAVDPSTKDIYSVSSTPPPGTVRRLLGTSRREAAVGVPGRGATAVALDPHHPLGSPVLYVVNAQDNTLSCLSAESLQTLATVAVGGRPRGIAVDPVHHTVYVANWQTNTLSVIDGATFQRTGQMVTGQGPQGVAVDPTGRLLYVTNTWDNTISTVRIE